MVSLNDTFFSLLVLSLLLFTIFALSFLVSMDTLSGLSLLIHFAAWETFCSGISNSCSRSAIILAIILSISDPSGLSTLLSLKLISLGRDGFIVLSNIFCCSFILLFNVSSRSFRKSSALYTTVNGASCEAFFSLLIIGINTSIVFLFFSVRSRFEYCMSMLLIVFSNIS